MARDILDLGADVFDDLAVAKKRRISPKKRNYIIGLSCLGLFLAGAITFTVIAANTWLLDMTNLAGLQFYYTPKDKTDPNAKEPTLTLYKLDSSISYPSTFRIPEKVQGIKVTAIAPHAFNGHTEIKKVVFTSYVDTIGDYAFEGCTNIENFQWNKSLANIGKNVFEDTKFYKNLQTNPSGVFAIPNTGVLIYLGPDYFDKDNIALVSDDFTDAEKQYVMSEFGIPNDNFIKFSHIGTENGGTGVTSFTAGLFKNNQRISYIDFPEFLKRLGEETFANCKNLKGISFAHSEIASITSGNFSGCTSLYDIKFSESLTELGDSAFANTKITKLPDLDNITTFGEKVFYGCTELKEVYYPDTEKLTKVPNGMFFNCTSLQDFYWGDKDNSGGQYIKTIGDGAFRNTPLVKFYVPKGVTTIQDDAFRDCKQLKELYFYGNPNEIYDESTIAKDEYGVYEYATEVDHGCFDIENFDTELRIELSKRSDIVVSPNEDGNYVFDITNPSEEFNFEKVSFTLTADQFETIKKAIQKERGDDEDPTGETSESSEEGEGEDDNLYIMVQDDSKFFAIYFEQDETTRKFTVTLKSTTSYTRDDDGNYHLGYLAGISDIRQDAFNNCTSLRTIYLYGEGGYTDIYSPEGVFTLPKSLTWLNHSAENRSDTMNTFLKTAAEKVYINSHVRKIGGYAFSKIDGLKEVLFAPHCDLQTIGEEAFSENPLLESISLPNTVKELGAAVFFNDTNLRTIELKNTEIEIFKTELFSNCSSLEHIGLPETLTKISDKVFVKTNSLDYVVVPKNVTAINKNAFYQCYNDIRGNMPIYLNMTLEEYNDNAGISKEFHDNTCEHFFLLKAGEEKVAGQRYWNGDASNPQEI